MNTPPVTASELSIDLGRMSFYTTLKKTNYDLVSSASYIGKNDINLLLAFNSNNYIEGHSYNRTEFKNESPFLPLVGGRYPISSFL